MKNTSFCGNVFILTQHESSLHPIFYIIRQRMDSRHKLTKESSAMTAELSFIILMK